VEARQRRLAYLTLRMLWRSIGGTVGDVTEAPLTGGVTTTDDHGVAGAARSARLAGS
jgi:hypothetical protein